MTGRIIIVEGNISAGKSTLTEKLQSVMDVEMIAESLHDNPYLELFYSNPVKYALPMQLFLLGVRYTAYKTAMRLADDGKDVILDRSIYSDCVFATKNNDDGNIDEAGYKLYLDIREDMFKTIRSPDIVLYLNTSPEICLNRIKNVRGRKCESDIPIDYLEGLDHHYRVLVDSYIKMNSKVHTLDWNEFGDTNSVLSLL